MSEKITIADAISFYEGRINSQPVWLETFRDGRPQDRRGAMDIEQHERNLEFYTWTLRKLQGAEK